MPNYISFTPEQREQARRTDLCALLKRQGETIRRAGSVENKKPPNNPCLINIYPELTFCSS